MPAKKNPTTKTKPGPAITWQVADEEVRAFVGDREVGLVRHDAADSLFYQAIVGGAVICTTNLPFEAMGAVADAVTHSPTPTEPDEMLATLEINKTSRRAAGAGTWVSGTIAGHDFEALVFPEHAESESYELDRSRISKLWLQEHFTHRQVAVFDRGWDVRPASDTAQQIVDLLAAGLAETVYGK